MRSPSRTSRSLLTDANSVIEAHRVGAWGALTRGWRVHVPGSVIDQEARHFPTPYGRSTIDLSQQVDAGAIRRLDATAWEMRELRQRLPGHLWDRLGDGERECLAILLSGPVPGLLLCTADRLAVHAACFLHLSHQVVSLEAALRACGASKQVREQYREDWLKRVLREGRVLAVQAGGPGPGRT